MNILVIGCDQVGASLVRDLERIGHDISIIEKDSEDRKSTRLNSSHNRESRMPSSA